MKVFKCDFCGRPQAEVQEITEKMATYLPSDKKEICEECANKLNDFLKNRRDGYLNQAWEETARFAKSLSQAVPAAQK